MQFGSKVEYKRVGKTKREEKMEDWVGSFEKGKGPKKGSVTQDTDDLLDQAKARLARALEKADNAGVQVKSDYSVSVFQAIESAKSHKLL